MRSLPNSWNKTLTQLGFKRKRNKKSWRRDYMRRRRFETLEPRQMLSVTVDTLVDELDGSINDGDISLRDALALVASGETIDFAPSLSGGTLTLTEGELTVDGNVTIAGPGADQLTIDGNDASRVFNVQAGVDATLKGLTITGGNVSGSDVDGGGIYNAGNLVLDSVVVVDNQSEDHGGGVYTVTGTNGTAAVFP